MEPVLRGRGSVRTLRDELLGALLDQLWRDGEFVAVGALPGRHSTSTSLLALMPIEPVTSPHDESVGYWRGPIAVYLMFGANLDRRSAGRTHPPGSDRVARGS